MNYLQKSKNRFPNRLKIIFIVSFFVVLSGLAFLFPKAMRGVFTTTAVPIWSVSDSIAKGFQNVTGFFYSKSSLTAQVSALQNQIASLELKQIDYDAIAKENQDLKSLFGQNVTNENGRVLVRVLSKPPQSPYDTFVLDAGSASGLAVGDKVYISNTVIIGEVASVSGETSIVNLFSKSGMVNSLSDSRTGAAFQVTGQGGANMTVPVPKDADVLWGDTFQYPDSKTSVVGSVFYIDQSAQSSFKTVFIRAPGNIFQTEWVFVEK